MTEATRAGRKSPEEWRALLPAESFAVLFREATEPPGSSPLNHEKRAGTFVCAACHLPLFESAGKYESGTGWPSFFAPIEGSLGTKRDFKMILRGPSITAPVAAGIRGMSSGRTAAPPGSGTATTASPCASCPRGESLPER